MPVSTPFVQAILTRSPTLKSESFGEEAVRAQVVSRSPWIAIEPSVIAVIAPVAETVTVGAGVVVVVVVVAAAAAAVAAVCRASRCC